MAIEKEIIRDPNEIKKVLINEYRTQNQILATSLQETNPWQLNENVLKIWTTKPFDNAIIRKELAAISSRVSELAAQKIRVEVSLAQASEPSESGGAGDKGGTEAEEIPVKIQKALTILQGKIVRTYYDVEETPETTEAEVEGGDGEQVSPSAENLEQ